MELQFKEDLFKYAIQSVRDASNSSKETLQLSKYKPGEPQPYRVFYRHPIVQMPLLVSGKDLDGTIVDVARTPASVACILEQRMTAPIKYRKRWQNNSFITGDCIVTGGRNRNQLIVLDAPRLRGLNPESNFYDENNYLTALALSQDEWNELRAQKENVFLNSREIEEVHGRGYVQKRGVWTPEIKTVAKVWEALSRGRDLTSYIEMVSEVYHQFYPKATQLLRIYLPIMPQQGEGPTMRPWNIAEFKHNSHIGDLLSPIESGHNLVGIAPNTNSLERRVR